jgi:hypothetical protein
MIRPPESAGRKESMDKSLSILRELRHPVILEYGMVRHPENWEGDGFSTIIFAHFIAQQPCSGTFISVDIKPANIMVSDTLLKKYEIPSKNVFLVCADAMDFMNNPMLKIEYVDLLYLDAWDYSGDGTQREESALHHLEAFQRTEKWLRSGSLVLIDDILNQETLAGKGQYLIPLLREIGYEELHKGYQFLFRKP